MSEKKKKKKKESDITPNSNGVRGEGLRYNKDKTRYDLIPPYAQQQYARVLTEGAKKYELRNWEKGMPWTTVLASLKRHVAAFEFGNDLDPETGVLHTAHIMCNAAFLTEYYRIYPQGDDRPHMYLKTPRIGLDIDEVICNWVGGWTEAFDMEVPENWVFDRNIVGRFEKMEKQGTLDDFYLDLEPLVEPSEIPFEPHCYVTSRPVATEVTNEWLDKNGFPSKAVYTVSPSDSKVDILLNANVEIFVDDRFENFVEINAAGICCYLMDAPHNQRYDVGHKRIYKLSDIVTGDHLIKNH